jgi:phage terminase Nu1 subunit (DNA packaging protein)
VGSEPRAIHALPDQLLTRPELAAAMRVSLRTIDDMRSQGMPCVTWGRRRVLFRLRDAMAWAEQQQREAA